VSVLFYFIILNVFKPGNASIEIKNLLYKRVLAKTAAAARYTKFQTRQQKTVTDNIRKRKVIFLGHSMNKTKTKTHVIITQLHNGLQRPE